MSRFVRWSVKAYGGILLLYPDDLRHNHGAEMLEAFSYDVAAACAVRSIRSVTRVWRIAMREVIHIAVPAWLQIPAVIVPALSVAVLIASQLPILMVTIRREAPMRFHSGDATAIDALLSIALEAAVMALTAFLVARRWKGSGPISLGLH